MNHILRSVHIAARSGAHQIVVAIILFDGPIVYSYFLPLIRTRIYGHQILYFLDSKQIDRYFTSYLIATILGHGANDCCARCNRSHSALLIDSRYRWIIRGPDHLLIRGLSWFNRCYEQLLHPG
ncbi:hypothetical protein D3C85_1255240 [compost metagenome]